MIFWLKVLAAYLVVINLVAFFTYALDKQKAIRNQWRIPESTLLLMAVAGGCLGAYLGMKLCHHKTQKPVFRFGIPGIICCYLIVFVVLFFRAIL